MSSFFVHFNVIDHRSALNPSSGSLIYCHYNSNASGVGVITVQGRRLGGFVHFLRLLAVFRPSAQSARDNHVLACNFAKYSPI